MGRKYVAFDISLWTYTQARLRYVIFFSEPGAVTALAASSDQSNPDSLQVAWVAPTTACAADNYIIEYQITNLDQCDPTPGTKIMFGEFTDTAITITGMHAFSTYMVFVSSNNSAGSTENNNPATTAQTGKGRPGYESGR